ncbi:hypothetical protein [Streptomyces sp. KL116D]|uniref:hypothetical protein n=1 Tax=Streptomyces sp. KL116D TaxID=3045152 RepID=UPI003557B4C4
MLWTVSTSLRSRPSPSTCRRGSCPRAARSPPTGRSSTSSTRWLLALNSALVTGLIAVGQMITAGLGGYAFARLDFRFKRPLFLAWSSPPADGAGAGHHRAGVPDPEGHGPDRHLLALIVPAVPTASARS